MKHAMIGAALVLGIGSACNDGIDRIVDPVSGRTGGPTVVTPQVQPVVDPVGTIESLTVTPDRGRSGTIATVTWAGGPFTYSVRIKQGRCAVSEDGTARESSCPALAEVAGDLPASGRRTVVLSETTVICVFPVRHAGMFAQGRCAQVTVIP